jgi:hypothetical protein
MFKSCSLPIDITGATNPLTKQKKNPNKQTNNNNKQTNEQKNSHQVFTSVGGNIQTWGWGNWLL